MGGRDGGLLVQAKGRSVGERKSPLGYGSDAYFPSLGSCSPNPAQASLSHQHPSYSESLTGRVGESLEENPFSSPEDITGLGLGGGKDGAIFSLLRGRMIVEEEPGC